MGVELVTCAELVLSAADATAKPTATKAKMVYVSLDAIPEQKPEQPATKTVATVASKSSSFAVAIEVTRCLRPSVAEHPCSSEFGTTRLQRHSHCVGLSNAKCHAAGPS